MVVACTALIFGMTGAGYAAGMLGPNTVGTKQLKKNAVISSKVKNRSLLAADFKAGQLPKGAKGDPGVPGAPGAPGAPGEQGPAGPGAQWATVNSAGTIVHSQAGSRRLLQTGGYVVTFPRRSHASSLSPRRWQMISPREEPPSLPPAWISSRLRVGEYREERLGLYVVNDRQSAGSLVHCVGDGPNAPE